VAQTCPLDIARNIERRWQSRSRAAIAAVLKNPDIADSGLCPDCNLPAPIAPLHPSTAVKERFTITGYAVRAVTSGSPSSAYRCDGCDGVRSLSS
jgi:hypothetical protein